MKDDWKDLNVLLGHIKNDKNIKIIKNFEEIINLSDEQISITNNIYYSPYKKVFEEEIDTWKNILEVVSLVLENWMKLQISYM